MSERRQNRVPAWSILGMPRVAAAARWVLVAVVACALSTRALAQVAEIPTAIIIQVEPLSPDQAKTVADYVTANSANLLSTVPELLKKDRDALLRPLATANVSVTFRLTYDKELIPKLTSMAASTTEMTIINALVICGDLATDRAMTIITSKLGAPKAAVRYEAAYALSQLFKAVQKGQPAIDMGKVDAAVKSLEALMTAEKDPFVLDSLIRAGLAAAELDAEREAAIIAVSRGVDAAAKAINPNQPDARQLDALLRATVGLRDIMAQAVQRQTRLSPVSVRDSAEFGGLVASRLSSAVQKKALPAGPGPLRDQFTQIAAASQTLIELCGEVLVPGQKFPLVNATGNAVKLGDDLRAGNVQGDARFIQDADGVAGGSGMLSKPPFK